MNDARDAIDRHIDLAESSAAVTPRLRSSSARCSPGWMGVRAMVKIPSMIIDDPNVDRPRRSFGPTKTDSPLIVDANQELSGVIAFERLQPVARQRRQISEPEARRRWAEYRADRDRTEAQARDAPR